MSFVRIVLIFVGLISLSNAISINKVQRHVSKRSVDNQYASSVKIDEVMTHLQALENIATSADGNRAVGTVGFNQTLDYISDYLSLNTNFQITKTPFTVASFQLLAYPTFVSTINGIATTHTFSTNLAAADFTYAQYSRSANLNSNVLLTAIPNLGCTDADWLAARPPPAGLVALVKRGSCTFEAKALLASKYNVAALLLYNDGSSSNIQPILANVGPNNRVAVLFLSYTIGQSLATAATDPSRVVTVRLTVSTKIQSSTEGNICAHTPTGDPTQTILIGSHSDSVPAGSGINDNGSGTAANLALAATLSRLLQTSNYTAFKYRVRFCWWGAEEIGLIGSAYHVSEAKTSSIVGERITDYLVNINLDMLGSPNFIFGIYYGQSAPSTTPETAKPGSIKMTSLFQNWFDDHNLPWDYTSFDGRSDYGPFLAAGVAAGGLFSGADGVKTVAQYNRYTAMLGSNLGGKANVRQDICYHKACDDITNINKFALEKMVQAAAYAVENLGQQSDLKTWLYPTRNHQQIRKEQTYEYNSINEYFGLPYY